MEDISVVSFIYNEETNIDNWLSSLKPYVKEIILFDLDSTDNTFEICKKYTDKIYKRPYLLCGDSYKQELQVISKSNWLLWAYPDERFTDNTLQIFYKLVNQSKWNAFSFMRQEYLDGIRVCFKEQNSDRILSFGTVECPNYQCRLHKNDGKLFYTELVHAELHGEKIICNLPLEYNIEHFKSSRDQEFDNLRLYIWYKFLIFKYGATKLEPYKEYIDSYKKIVFDSEVKNLSGERGISLSEEFWWDWQKYSSLDRISLDKFKELTGISYEFFKSGKIDREKKIIVNNDIKDVILKEMEAIKKDE